MVGHDIRRLAALDHADVARADVLAVFSISPCQPFFTRSAIASDAIAIALTPSSGRLPAWLARPSISIVIR